MFDKDQVKKKKKEVEWTQNGEATADLKKVYFNAVSEDSGQLQDLKGEP